MLAGWNVEKVAIAPLLDAPARVAIEERGYVAEDLADLTKDLSPRPRREAAGAARRVKAD